MSEYQKIKNPITNRFVSTGSYLGKKIIQKYISMLGGGAISNDVDYSPVPSRFDSAQSFHNDSDDEESVNQTRFGRVESDSDWAPSRFDSAQSFHNDSDDEESVNQTRFGRVESDSDWAPSRFDSAQSFHNDSDDDEPIERFHTAKEEPEDDSDSDEHTN